jgi:biopolymer transport protein ExbB/TolQ
MGTMSNFGNPMLELFVMLFLIVLGVLWFLLPFAVFGVKDRLDQLIKAQRKTNELMKKLLDTQKQLDMTVKVEKEAQSFIVPNNYDPEERVKNLSNN